MESKTIIIGYDGTSMDVINAVNEIAEAVREYGIEISIVDEERDYEHEVVRISKIATQQTHIQHGK
jgi:hypothetical protein